MWTAFLGGVVSALNAVASVLGVTGTLVLIAVVLLAFLFFVFMILRFGERAIEMLLPFVREIFRTLRSKATKAHPAIRVELVLHCLFGMIFVLCLLASLLHALVPFVRDSTEHLFLYAFVTSGVISTVLAGVSVTLAVRLK